MPFLFVAIASMTTLVMYSEPLNFVSDRAVMRSPVLLFTMMRMLGCAPPDGRLFRMRPG